MASHDQVGYGRPPKHSQFKPGQSGNPRGRKPKSTALIEQSATILSKPIRTRDRAGRKRTLQTLEASYLALCKDALSGDRSALLNVMRTLLIVGPEIDDENEAWEREIWDARQKFYQKLGLSQDEIDQLNELKSSTSRRY